MNLPISLQTYIQANSQKALALCLAALAVLAPAIHADAAPLPGYKLPTGFTEMSPGTISVQMNRGNARYDAFREYRLSQSEICDIRRESNSTGAAMTIDCTPYADLRGSDKTTFDILDYIYYGTDHINKNFTDKNLPAAFKKPVAPKSMPIQSVK